MLVFQVKSKVECGAYCMSTSTCEAFIVKQKNDNYVCKSITQYRNIYLLGSPSVVNYLYVKPGEYINVLLNKITHAEIKTMKCQSLNVKKIFENVKLNICLCEMVL